MYRYVASIAWERARVVFRAVVICALLSMLAATSPAIAEPENEEPCGEGPIYGTDPATQAGKKAERPAAGNPMIEILEKVPPKYPERARVKKLQARVLLSVVIEKDGSVGCVKPFRTDVRRSGEKEPDAALAGYAPDFERAAKEAAHRWRYAPPTLGGEVVRLHSVIVVDFQLQ